MFSFYEIVLPSVCFFFIDYPSIKREFLKIYGFILTLSCYFRSWNSRYSLAHSTLFPPLSGFEGREEGRKEAPGNEVVSHCMSNDNRNNFLKARALY